MKKAFKWILILIIVLAGMSAGYIGMARLNNKEVPSFLKKMPLVGKLFPAAEGKGKKLSPLEKENLSLKDQIEKQKLEIKTYKDRITALEQSEQALEAENKKLADQNTALEVSTVSSKEDKYKELAKYYEAMKPKDAAKILEQKQIDDDTIIGILRHMDKETAGKIMSLLDPARAAVLSQKMLQ